MRSISRRWLALVGIVVMVAALVAGCSSDKNKATGATSGDTVAATNDTSATSAATPTEACQAWVAVDKAASAGPGGEEEQPTAEEVKAFAAQLKTVVDTFAKAAPSEVKTNATAIQAQVTKAMGGDGSAIDPSSDALGAPLAAVESWVHEACGFQNLDVMGVDYAFEDLPTALKAGPTSIEFMNHADDEQHEIAIMRLHEGVAPAELVAALKQDAGAAQQQYGDKVDFVAETSAAPGKTGATTLDLEAGNYVAVCFIPVGGAEDGVPHAQKGMVQAFTVG